MNTDERRQIVAIALNVPNHRDVHILGVYHSSEENRVSLTEMHYYLRPSTGKPYPIDGQTYILDAAKLFALMECVGTFDMNKLLQALADRARNDTNALLEQLHSHADDFWANEYFYDVAESEWADVDVILAGNDGATGSEGGSTNARCVA